MDTMIKIETIYVHCVQWTQWAQWKQYAYIVLTFIYHYVSIVHNQSLLYTMYTYRVHCVQCVYCRQCTLLLCLFWSLCPLCTMNVQCDQWTFIVSIVFIVSIIPIMLIGRNQPKCNLQPIDVVWVCPLWTLKWTQWTSISPNQVLTRTECAVASRLNKPLLRARAAREGSG